MPAADAQGLVCYATGPRLTKGRGTQWQTRLHMAFGMRHYAHWQYQICDLLADA